MQADYMRDFLTAAFAHDAVDGVTIWGFWAGAHWRATAALYTQDWTETAQAAAFRDLVMNQWQTHETVTTDANGEAKLRAFKGDYRVSSGGAEATGSVGDEASVIEIKR
jgi:hypothetical protein